MTERWTWDLSFGLQGPKFPKLGLTEYTYELAEIHWFPTKEEAIEEQRRRAGAYCVPVLSEEEAMRRLVEAVFAS